VSDEERSRSARAAAEAALVRVVHHYGSLPEFVLLGGLVPELLCASSDFQHAGTTDVDVQVDLEIALGGANSRRLEHALRNAEFEPDGERAWRWVAEGTSSKTVVKFELLADLDTEPAQSTVRFAGADGLGAVNLRGTGFASRDFVVHELRTRIGGVVHLADVKVTGLAGFLLAKVAAAYSRRKPKDWYDIAFVLLNNDAGGPSAAARAVLEHFGAELVGSTRTALDDLGANFHSPSAQGPQAYASQMVIDHEGLDDATAAADAVAAVEQFLAGLASWSP
jgi:hypothetical protein